MPPHVFFLHAPGSAPRPSATVTTAPGAVQVRTSGGISSSEGRMLRDVVGEVLAGYRLAGEHVRIRLSRSEYASGSALAQVNLRVHGASARVQVSASSPAQAVEECAVRLDRQLRRLTGGWQTWPWPDPQRQMLMAPFKGKIVRLKSVRPHTRKPCQAAAAMNAMDYDFHLFTDAGTGEDAVVYRAGPTGVRLARQHSMHPAWTPPGSLMTVNPVRVPTLTPDHAAGRSAEGWLPFLFFTDLATGRGNLLYRRYDGDLALLRPEIGSA